MKPSFRIEIVVEEPLARQLIELLKRHRVPGYTVIPRAGGNGDRGVRRGDELAGDSSNCVFIVVCDDREKVSQLTEDLRPMLTRHGGMCVVSPCESLRH